MPRPAKPSETQAGSADSSPPRRSWKRRIVVWSFICLTSLASAPLWSMLIHGVLASPRKADAIVIPGAALRKGGTELSDALRWRMDTGIELWKSGYAPIMVLSGGGDGAWNEPKAMAKYAVERGVPESAILLDSGGDSTRQTAQNVSSMLRSGAIQKRSLAAAHASISASTSLPREDDLIRAAREYTDPIEKSPLRVLVVSQWYHVPRLRLAFRQEGVQAAGSACRHPNFLSQEPRFVLREYVALGAYALRMEHELRGE